jgi:hypothetical protein
MNHYPLQLIIINTPQNSYEMNQKYSRKLLVAF